MWFLVGNQHVANPNDPDQTQATTPGFAGQTRFVSTKDTSGNDDGKYKIQMCLYNATGAALTKSRPYLVEEVYVKGQTPQVLVATAVASVPRLIAVATSATAIGVWDWFDVAGEVDVLTDGSGTPIVAGDWLKLAPGTSAVALIHDAATGAGNQTVNSLAVASTATSVAATSQRVRLLGLTVVINT